MGFMHIIHARCSKGTCTDELMQRTIDAMQSLAPDRDAFAVDARA